MANGCLTCEGFGLRAEEKLSGQARSKSPKPLPESGRHRQDTSGISNIRTLVRRAGPNPHTKLVLKIEKSLKNREKCSKTSHESQIRDPRRQGAKNKKNKSSNFWSSDRVCSSSARSYSGSARSCSCSARSCSGIMLGQCSIMLGQCSRMRAQYSTLRFAQAGEINNFSSDLRIFGRLCDSSLIFRHGLPVPSRLVDFWQNFTLFPLAPQCRCGSLI